MTPEQREQLIALLQNKQSRADVVKAMASQRAHEHRTKLACKQYQRVVVDRVCRHCGLTTSTEYDLEPKEHISIIDKSGDVYEIHYHNITDPMTVVAYVNHCVHCASHIKKMPRWELEARYLALLKHHDTYLSNNKKVADGVLPEKQKYDVDDKEDAT